MRAFPVYQRFILTLILLLILPQGRAQDTHSDTISLYVADGQLMSHPFSVFVTHDITTAMQPQLLLRTSHTFSSVHKKEFETIKPIIIARNQISTEMVVGQNIQLTGTLLLFDLQNYPVSPYKGMTRITPILTWTESTADGVKVEQAVVASHEVNLGNIAVAVAWTIAMTAMLIIFIAFLARRSGHPVITFFCSSDGRLSLARTQVALWTVAIGMVVGGYGMLRLEVPNIPDTLVILMGMSLLTGGVSYMKSDKKDSAAAVTVIDQSKPLPPALRSKIVPRLSDLVCIIDEHGSEQLSLVRAQMVFWTGLTVVMFMTKSVLDGVLWNIPLEMVGLMGMSQAAYLSPKLVSPK